MTIVIVGASGRTSSYVLRALLSSTSLPVRAVLRSERGAESLRTEHPSLMDAVSVQNYINTGEVEKALHGAKVVWYNAHAFVPNTAATAISVIDAAMRAGAEHFVFCSVLHPLLTKLINHEEKLPIEEYLIESGFSYTILQPTSFMENIPIPKVLSDAKLPCMYTPTVLQGFLALDDIAEVAVKVILNPREHAFARYELVGENRTLEEVATLMSEALGKKVEAFVTPRHEAVEKFSKEKGITTLNGKDNFERMLFYYDKRGIPGNTNILRWLLGREPTTWTQLIERALVKQSS